MKNQLSAFIDGEIDIKESEHLLTALKTKGEAVDAWKNYHLIGDVIRGDAILSHDFSSKLMSALESEPTVLAVNKQQMKVEQPVVTKIKTPVFWSIAASMAAVMFVGLMMFELQLGETEDMTPVEIAQSLPLEYLQAHQSVAPTGSSYYIQAASFSESK